MLRLWGAILIVVVAGTILHAQIVETSGIAGTGRTTIRGTTGTTRVRAQSRILALGDSKTQGDSWQDTLMDQRASATGFPWASLDRGVPGATVASTLTNLATVLALPMHPMQAVLVNFGANDVGTHPSEAQWKADYLSLIDAVRAVQPAAPIYLARPWVRVDPTQCNSYATWIAWIVTQRSNVYLGMDERVWLEGGDNGATMTLDGTHYSAAGEVAAAAAWAAVLWP